MYNKTCNTIKLFSMNRKEKPFFIIDCYSFIITFKYLKGGSSQAMPCFSRVRADKQAIVLGRKYVGYLNDMTTVYRNFNFNSQQLQWIGHFPFFTDYDGQDATQKQVSNITRPSSFLISIGNNESNFCRNRIMFNLKSLL